MAKKRFTDDLSGLFEDAFEQQSPAAQAASGEDSVIESVEVQVPATTAKVRKKLSSKRFTADLDAFLTDSFARESTSPPAITPDSAPAPAPSSPPRRKRRKTGLDLLIQSTVTDAEQSFDRKAAPDTKRVTLIFNKQHLAELKAQAKLRGVYLKDVVQEMVSAYLEK